MTGLIDATLLIVALLLLPPVVTLAVQVAAAILLRGRNAAPPSSRPRIAVLVPAHNEALMIAGALENLGAQLVAGDRLVVVADNCSDDTVNIARRAGADVVVRDEPDRRGKGFALAFGLQALQEGNPPEVVVFVDADCRCSRGAIAEIAALSLSQNRPVQADYVLTATGSRPLSSRIGEFAFLLRNRVRALGCLKLGTPCQLTGSGMAIPWKLLGDINFAAAHLTEDLVLGIDLALSGAPPLYCPTAHVVSPLPLSESGRASQRKRWELGHLSVIASYAPRLFARAISRGDANLLAMAFDLCVPPLALLTIALFLALGAAALGPAFGASPTAAAILLAMIFVFSATILSAWGAFGRHLLSARELAFIPAYVLRKFQLYVSAFFGRRIGWERSERG